MTLASSSPLWPRRGLCLFVLLLVPLGFANGCAWLVAPPQSDALALQQVARWTDHNQTLKQFKGLYSIRVDTPNQSLSVRAALAAGIPDHLRVELLNLLGQPLLSLAADGEHIYVLEITEQKFYRIRQSPTALEPFIHVPLGTGALLDALSGRPPLPDYTAAQAGMGPDSTTMILLKDRWHNLVADLRSDSGNDIECLHRFGTDGAMQAEIHWSAWRTINGYRVPARISMKSGNGEQVVLSLERLWTEVSLPPSTFVLEPPGSP